MSQMTIFMLVALVGEVLLLLLAWLLVSYLRNRAQRSRDAKAARTLVARIRQGKAEREQALVQFLGQQAGLSGEALEKAKVAMLRAELGFLQRLAGIYAKRESNALARIDGDLFAAIEPYHGLTIAADGDASAVDGEPADTSELDFLRKENKRLSDELTITMETMSRMLNEYSTMFADANVGDAAPIDAAVGVAASAGEVAAEAEDLLIAADRQDAAAEAPGPGEPEPAVDPEAGTRPPADDGNPFPDEDPFGGIEVSTGEGDIEIDEAEIDDAEIETTGADAGFASPTAADTGTDTDGAPATDPEWLFDGASEDTGATAAETVDLDSIPVEAAADDPVAEILRQAQTREASARGTLEATEAEDRATGTLAEAGPVELVTGDDADVEAVDIDDIDDLFDATDSDDAVDGRSNRSVV